MPAPRCHGIDPGQRLLAAVVGALLVVGTTCWAVAAQVSPPARSATAEPSPGSTGQPGPAAGDLSDLPPKTLYLPNEQGILVPVPYGAKLEAYLQSLQAPAETRTEKVPAAVLSEIELFGTADDERATLNVRITLSLQPENPQQYIRVPLRLQEGILESFEMTGDAQSFPANWSREEGYAWWFRGQGEQRLLLKMSVPIRRQQPTRRLQLSVPAAAVSSLKLSVPHRAVAFRTPDQTTLQSVPMADGGSACSLSGLGPRLDLTWQPSPEKLQDEGALETQTTYLCRLNPDSLVIEATQRIQALQGTFGSMQVQLPAKAEILKLEGRDYQSHKVNPDVPDQCVVTLQSASTGPVSLKWTLRVPLDERRRLTLTGLNVERARKQTGEIGFILLEGWRLSSSESKDANLVRINAGELRAVADSAQIQRAYRFLSQPFQLPVALDPVEPYVVVAPQLMLEVAADQLSLEGLFNLQVFRGAATELSLRWPGWKAEGWTIESVEPRELVEGFTDADSEEPGLIRVRLTESRRGSFSLIVKARRLLPQSRGEIALTLPIMAGSAPNSPVLVVANAENVESELTAGEGTILRPLAGDRRDELTLPGRLTKLKRTESRIDGPNRAFKLRITEHEQRIRTESLTEVELRGDRLGLTQRIQYVVEYQRLPQLRLLSPPGLATDRIQFFAADRLELTPAWQPELADGSREVLLSLEEAKLGRFELEIRTTLPAPDQPADGGELMASIPILQSLESEFTTTSLEFQHGEWQDESSPGDGWKLHLTDSENQRWTAAGARMEFPLQLIASRGGDAGPFVVNRTWIRARFDAQRSLNCRAQFRLNGRGSTMMVTLPSEVEAPRFAWGQLVLEQASVMERPSGSGRYQLRLPETASELNDHLLTVDYVVAGDGLLRGTDRITVPPPKLQPATWVAQTVWTIDFPSDQHLFDYPRQMTPMYRWERQGVIWRRVPHPEQSSLEDWIGSTSGPSLPSIEIPVNSYSFSQMGIPSELRIRSLSAPLVLLFGAGISLTAGFVLIQVRVVRHVLSVLILGLLFALAGLWFMPLLELLLQPMIAGLIFPLCAVLIQRWNRSRHFGAVLTLGSDGDSRFRDAFSGNRTESAGSEFSSEEATQLRTPNSEADAMHYETGSGVS